MHIEFHRGSLVESIHRADVCVVDSSGEEIFTSGSPDRTCYLRSSAKPLQALTAVASGAAERYGFSASEIAVITGSHGGDQFQVDAVGSILVKAGLTPDLLLCGVHPPLDRGARERLETRGEPPNVLHNNCSGKHAAMLAAANHFGFPLSDYIDPNSSIQRLVVKNIAEIASMRESDVILGTDGCSLPAQALPLRSTALAFARLVDGKGISPRLAQAAQIIYHSMTAHPEMVAAPVDRICTQLIRAGVASGVVAKAGAEGYYAAGWRDPDTGAGVGMSLKVEDGAQRARDPLVIKLLQKFRALPNTLPDKLQRFATGPLLNWRGLTVGEIVVKI